MIGLRVGPFEITHDADVPESGEWFVALRTHSNRRTPERVLIRVLGPDADHRSRAAMKDQYDRLRAFDHPRIPAPIALYEGLGAMAVKAEPGVSLVECVPLRKTNELAMTPGTLLDIILELAESLQHAHHRSRIHGHLSPSSVLLDRSGQIWIHGFGDGSDTAPQPQWCSPERARGDGASTATDQWSLAALATALITGRQPWDDNDNGARARVGDPEEMVAPIERQWPALARVLRKMLDNRPSNRYAGMNLVRQDLLGLARKAGGTSDRRTLAAALHNLLPNAPEGPPAAFLAEPSESEPEEAQGEEPQDAGPTPTPEAPDPASEPDVAESLPEAEVAIVPTEDPASTGDAASDSGIHVARSVAAGTAARATDQPPPDEAIPVVRPDPFDEVPVAGTPSTAKIPAMVESHPSDPGIDESDPASTGDPDSAPLDTDEQPTEQVFLAPDFETWDLNQLDAGDPKSVSDPPSLSELKAPREAPPSADVSSPSESAADYVADDLQGRSELSGGDDAYGIPDGGDPITADVTDDSPEAESDGPAPHPMDPTPTIAPITDSDLPSEEVAIVPPAPAPASGPASDWLGDGVAAPSSLNEPSLGLGHAEVSLTHEPDLESDTPDAVPLTLPEPGSRIPQQIALGVIALMVVVGVLSILWQLVF